MEWIVFIFLHESLNLVDLLEGIKDLFFLNKQFSVQEHFLLCLLNCIIYDKQFKIFIK